MTFKITTRGAGGLVVAEYRCPVHGVFEATVERNELGDAPDEHCCPAIPDCYAAIDQEEFTVPTCALISPWTPSAPKPKIWSKPATAAVRGGDMKDRPPGMLDTRALADGMPYGEWQKKQAEAQRARRHQELIDKGITQKKITVSG